MPLPCSANWGDFTLGLNLKYMQKEEGTNANSFLSNIFIIEKINV